MAKFDERMNKIKAERKEERQTALEEWKDRFPLPKKTSFEVDQFIADDEAFEALMDTVAEGNSVRHFCKQLQMPAAAIVKLNRYLAKLKAPHARFEMYRMAKSARAHQHADVMLNIIENVNDGLMTVQQGTMSLRGLQWLAARLDQENFSDRIKVDQNVKLDTASSHLEAVRMMAEMVKGDRRGTIIQGERVIEVTPEDEDPYGLLE